MIHDNILEGNSQIDGQVGIKVFGDDAGTLNACWNGFPSCRSKSTGSGRRTTD
jgi:hypothetical protein